MNVSAVKESILKKIRAGLSEPTPIPFPNSEGSSSVFQPSRQEMEVEFAEQFTQLQGKFIFCIDYKELTENLSQLTLQRQWKKLFCCEDKLKDLLRQNLFAGFSKTVLKDADASITGCEALVARTGSIVMSAGQQSGRTVSVYAPVHLCIAFTSQLVYDIKDALQLVKEKYGAKIPSLITFATGPSRTADIEKTLVVGVHGPKEVFLFLVDA